MSDLATVDTTYDRFAHDPAYVAANRAFVLRLPLARVRRILDLACGTGAVGQLMLAAAPEAGLYGIDLDPVQIGLRSRTTRNSATRCGASTGRQAACRRSAGGRSIWPSARRPSCRSRRLRSIA